MDIGPLFQKRRGAASTTIKVHFLRLLENKVAIIKTLGSLILMISCVVKYNTFLLFYDIDSNQKFLSHLRLYHHYDLSGSSVAVWFVEWMSLTDFF